MTKLSDPEEIQRFSVELFAREQAVHRHETTPRNLTGALRDFCRTLQAGEPAFIPVVTDKHGRYGFCSDGVLSKVKSAGGRAVFGWNIWEWPGAFWTAEFHAVWQAPDGSLNDITPKPGGEATILFVADLNYPPEFNFDVRPGNKRKRAYPDQDKPAMAAELMDRLKPSQRAYEEVRAQRAGIPLQAWMERKVPTDHLPTLLDQWLAACDDHEDYLDTLGVSGNVVADHKLIELNNRRVILQRQVKPLLSERGL